ncbi:MAG: cell division protein FtsL [Coxiella sp. RIFCSPHIGHO2_12_FULL_44_14]|nr:MAG: cell division protein FtsL [Coxiella sp. RIFCSPHIGHO2_12_FULL_44_14]
MNTLTKVMTADSVSVRQRSVLQVTAHGLGMTLLVITLLLSAFAVIYMKDLNRRLFIQYQTLQQEKAETLIEWGKLLLEQSTWSTQSRIQKMAVQQWGMRIPDAHDIVLLKNRDADAVR